MAVALVFYNQKRPKSYIKYGNNLPAEKFIFKKHPLSVKLLSRFLADHQGGGAGCSGREKKQSWRPVQ
jgi:hypothetical protein